MRGQEMMSAMDQLMAASFASFGAVAATGEAGAAAVPAAVERHTATSAWTGTEEAVQCVICMEDLAVGDEVRTLPCGHHYHKDCVDSWLRRSNMCCTCKRPINA